MEGDRGRDIHVHARARVQRDGERGGGIYCAWKEDGRDTGGLGGWKGLGRTSERERKRSDTWKHARRTRADASIRGVARGARVHIYVRRNTRTDDIERPCHAHAGAGSGYESARDTGYATGTKLRSP